MRRRSPAAEAPTPPVRLVVFDPADWSAAVDGDGGPPRWWAVTSGGYPWSLYVARQAWLAARRTWRARHGVTLGDMAGGDRG